MNTPTCGLNKSRQNRLSLMCCPLSTYFVDGWTFLLILDRLLIHRRSGHTACLIGSDVVVFGGCRGRNWLNDVFVLDTGDQWNLLMNICRRCFAMSSSLPIYSIHLLDRAQPEHFFQFGWGGTIFCIIYVFCMIVNMFQFCDRYSWELQNAWSPSFPTTTRWWSQMCEGLSRSNIMK